MTDLAGHEQVPDCGRRASDDDHGVARRCQHAATRGTASGLVARGNVALRAIVTGAWEV